jgi:hypothetical protein
MISGSWMDNFFADSNYYKNIIYRCFKKRKSNAIISPIYLMATMSENSNLKKKRNDQ